MKPYINEITAAQYRHLSAIAAEIEHKLQELLVETVKADIPDDAKLATLKWLERAETFRGLSYFLNPQTEWTGGDSSDPNNFKLRAPHIAQEAGAWDRGELQDDQANRERAVWMAACDIRENHLPRKRR